MSFIKESYLAYKKVQEVLEKETSDHEIAMARSELEGIADKATATSSMLEGMTESGNPLPAWVQSKITNASDYITSVHDYLKYNPQINESVSLEETTFEKIYQMQQDGKSVEDIAKELNLKADLVKKVLGESKTILEGLSDAQIAQLKKEYEPLKGKTITTSQYQQLKNILFKLQDGDLEKLQKQNIPFASTGAGSILRVRKSPVKITSVKVPGLEGMAEENDYVAVHTKGKVSVTANTSYEAAKKAAEKLNLKGTAGITVMLSKKDGENVVHKATEEVEGMAEEKIPQDYLDYLRTIVLKNVDFYEVPPKQIIQSWRDEKNKDRFKGKMVDFKENMAEEIKVDKPAILKSLQDRLKKLESDPDHGGKQDMIAYVKSKIKMIQSMKEEIELQEKPSIKQFVIFTSDKGTTHKEFSAYSEPELNKQIGDYLKQNPGYKVLKKEPVASIKETFKDNIVKKLVKPIQDFNKKKEEPKKEAVDNPYAIGMAAAMKATGDTPPLKKSTIVKAHKIADKVKKEEVEITETHFSMGQHVIYKPTSMTPRKAQIIQVTEPQVGAYYKIKISPTLMTYAKPDELELDEACWTGYKQVGLKKKGKRMVPNCVPEERRLYIESIVAVKNKAEKSGMPYSILKQVYDRGMAAWKGGHRPGATQVQWALARVNSFVTKSSGTWGGADSDLAKKVKG